MKKYRSNLAPRFGFLTVVALGIGTTTFSAETTTLKDTYKPHFQVGAAINRTIAMSTAVRADNVNRTSEQVDKDIALVQEQFN